MALAGQASTEMETKHARLGLDMVTPRQAWTADVLPSARQPPLVVRTKTATHLYQAIKARLMRLSFPGLRSGENGPDELLAERRQSEGRHCTVLCIRRGGLRHAIIREVSGGDRTGDWAAMPALGSFPNLYRM